MQATMGSRIAGERVKRRWLQKDLAAKAGVSVKHLSRVESDNVNPSADLLARIASALDTSMDYLQGRSAAP